MLSKNNIAIFPILENLPIVHGFSWGNGAPNMSDSFTDPNIIEFRVSDFLNGLGISSSTVIVKINPSSDGYHDPEILEITRNILKRELTDSGEIEVSANSIFTKISEVVLTVKPADCAICVLYFENKKGEKFVGLIHCSAKATDSLLAKKTIEFIKDNFSVNPKDIKIGITPAISKEYFYVNEGEINEDNWKEFMKKENGLIFLDLVGNILDQLRNEGIVSENIQYVGVDTFTSALEGKTFSQRLARDLNMPNGRYIVAVGLK